MSEPLRAAVRANEYALHDRLLRLRDQVGLPNAVSALRILDVIAWREGKDLDLQNGRIDLGFDDAVYFNSAFETAGGALAFTGPEIVGSIWGEGEGLGIRKADTDLRDKFSEAIKSALADGTVKNLSMKWFKIDVSPQQ